MKTFLKLTLLSVAIAAATFTSLSAATDSSAPAAAPAKGHLRALVARRGEARHQIAKKLDLTKDQVAQLKATRAQTAASIKAIRSDATLSTDQKKAKIRETVASTRTSLHGVLTADQQAKLKHFRAKHHKHHRR